MKRHKVRVFSVLELMDGETIAAEAVVGGGSSLAGGGNEIGWCMGRSNVKKIRKGVTRVKSRAALLSAILVLALALSVGAVASVAAAEDVTITHYVYTSHGTKWQDYLETMAERFKAETGITVSFVISPSGTQYQSKLLSMIAGGVSPDVSDANPAVASSLLGQGIYEDLTPYMKRDKLPLNEMPPSAIAGTKTPDGLQWGIPVSVYPVITFFNADMFAEAGLANPRELGENWTWDTLTSSAKALTIDSDGNGTPEKYGLDRIDARWEMSVHQAGGQLYDRIVYPTESRFNTEPVREAAAYLQNLTVNHYANRAWGQSVYTGNVAISTINGPGIIGNQMATVPFSWDVTTQPKGPANRTPRVNPDGFQVLAASNYKEEAWEWVHYLVADVDRQIEMAKITGRFPSLRRAMMEYPNVVKTLPPNWQAIIQVAFDPDGYAAYVEPLSAQTGPIVRANLEQIWTGKVAPATALEKIDEQLTAIFAENN